MYEPSFITAGSSAFTFIFSVAWSNCTLTPSDRFSPVTDVTLNSLVLESTALFIFIVIGLSNFWYLASTEVSVNTKVSVPAEFIVNSIFNLPFASVVNLSVFCPLTVVYNFLPFNVAVNFAPATGDLNSESILLKLIVYFDDLYVAIFKVAELESSVVFTVPSAVTNG